MSEVSFGIDFECIPEVSTDPNFGRLREIAERCEELGYHSLWMMDHLIWGKDPIFECWTTLSALASATKKIRLGSIVLCNSYRQPSLVAKMGATLDVISGGRLEFGIGAGWKEDEYLAYGFPFPRASVRIEQLKEAVTIIKKMWTEKRPSFQGKYYQIREAVCEPKPIQKPHPPVFIGGEGERLTLKVVAELADWCNISGSPEHYKHKLKVLEKHCYKVGRDPQEISKSWIGCIVIAKESGELKEKLLKALPKNQALEDFLKKNIVGTPVECVVKIQEYIDLGVTYFVVDVTSCINLRDDIQIFAKEVMSHFT